MKFLITNSQVKPEGSAGLPYKIFGKRAGNLTVLSNEEDIGSDSTSFFSITDGYVRDLDLPISDDKNRTEEVIQQNFLKWPLPYNITGSFSSTIVNKKTEEIFLCNDLIGIYPLYYLKQGKRFYVSNSIILMGIISGVEQDVSGIVQRCSAPEFSNIGSRTILKNCKRLLPGEWLRLNSEGEKLKVKFDNSLYQDLSSPAQVHDMCGEYWKAFKKDVAYSLNKSDEVKVALSGGMDSRIVLGALPENKKVECITFGESGNYETKIASRLAKKRGAAFKSFSQPELSFPAPEILKKYTLETEAVYLYSWLEILENAVQKKDTPFLTGDFTTALTGRTIKRFSGKKFGQKNFIKHYFLQKDYEFEANTPENFDRWADSVLAKYERWYSESRLSQFKLKIDRVQLLDDLHKDLNEVFSRIRSHRLPYIELVDELFTWYTHSRIPMGKQVLICNKNFQAFCPSMSMQNLRMASNIHPNRRLSFRFVNKLFGSIKELKVLSTIPTSQAPLIPQRAPDLLRLPVWGLRAKLDQFFINRLMKSKDINKRYRLFKSTNWAQIYQNPEMENNMRSYFKENHLGEKYFQILMTQAIHRKSLERWPFANMEIINASSLNMELTLIKNHYCHT